MPIEGLSQEVRLPRRGRIRLGIKVNGRESDYPHPVDYFVCPPEVQHIYGDRPRELNIMFPTEDAEQWASQYYRCYSHSHGLICKGDGNIAMALVDPDTGELASRDTSEPVYRPTPCPGESCPEYGHRCRRVMNLQFLLPDVPGLGVWQLDTSSYWSMVNINSGIKLVLALCGRISMVALLLRLVPHRAHPRGTRQTIYVLELDMAGKINDIKPVAPGRKAVLPVSDADVPGDLFPREPAEQFSSRGQLFAACYERYGLVPSQVLAKLGLKNREGISDLGQVWQSIVALER